MVAPAARPPTGRAGAARRRPLRARAGLPLPGACRPHRRRRTAAGRPRWPAGGAGRGDRRDARLARLRPYPGGPPHSGWHSPAAERRVPRQRGTAGAARARRAARGPAARAARHRHVQLCGRAGPRLRAVNRGAQHRGSGPPRLHRGLGSVPGRPAGPRDRAVGPRPGAHGDGGGGPRRLPRPAWPARPPPPVDGGRGRNARRRRADRQGQAPRHRALAPGAGNPLAARPWRRHGQHRGRRDQHHRDRDKRADRASRHGAGQRRVRQDGTGAGARLHAPLRAARPGQHRLAPGRTPPGANVKQLVQPVNGGPVTLLDVPGPVLEPTEGLVRTLCSVISPGTERAVTALAQSSLLAKARARPDLVRQVARRARTEGIASTRREVLGRLALDVPPGYSAAGIVLEAGAAVTGIRPGQLVATGGAGKANHAELQAVPWLLCAPVPAAVSVKDAAFTTLASIALHGLRLAEMSPGSKVVVVGLGLIGQLAARLAMAAGCDVAGIDPVAYPRDAAARAGVLALDERGQETTEHVLAWSRGRGADAVLVCAAGRSPDAVMRVPGLCRDRAAVVIVGDVGLQLDRTPFYQRELSLRFARSYGPGRYDPSYEAWGVDYPAGHVRWSEGRNFEAVLDLLAAGRLAVADLVTHTFDIGQAAAAYQLIEGGAEPHLAIRLDYPGTAEPERPVTVRQARCRH